MTEQEYQELEYLFAKFTAAKLSGSRKQIFPQAEQLLAERAKRKYWVLTKSSE